MKQLLVVFCLALGASGFALAAKGSAMASVPVFGNVVEFQLPAGYVKGNEQTAQGQYILELIPKGQTVENWKTMITVQGFKGAGATVKTPWNFLEGMARGYAKACPGKNIAIELGQSESGDTAAVLLGCAGANGELAFIQSTVSGENVLVVQKAMRTPFEKAKPPVNADNWQEFVADIRPVRVKAAVTGK